MRNSYMREILKIGQTERHPRARAQELSDHEGVPGIFEIVYCAEVSDRILAERDIHRAIKDRRIADNKEFFTVSEREAIQIVEDIALRYIHKDISHAPERNEDSKPLFYLLDDICPSCGRKLRHCRCEKKK